MRAGRNNRAFVRNSDFFIAIARSYEKFVEKTSNSVNRAAL
ncbi:Uncharacterized protein YP598_0024 [Yersinia pseudotuberculosis]|uniref:Uncharacterized protein n=1 Tax=Yersinia pseudotuberculosis serotype O:1b (strain IP 31758) TaxID=349747 RepID=A0A0U1R0U1_YERP3|nr:hypothetical protein YpsIP31758_4134 [Yersinia pseudotuberculosis IP 31758]UFA59652.1 Uncharacterized protein YP598_0024 [Yersinia pseudotuberculosis]